LIHAQIVSRGLDVIGMVKNDNKRFLVQSEKLSLKERYTVSPVHVVIVRHRTKKNEWLAELTTDLSLSVEDVIRIYAIR
jgi:CO dehydrogenase nickel-insertion accessory protein CooC1